MQSSRRLLRGLPVCALALALLACASTPTAEAAFILEVDTDGLDDGVLTYNPNFSFGGDTTAATQSNPSTAYGMSGGDSIFGGNGASLPDTYVFTYDPSVDSDNLAVPPYQSLGGTNYASGNVGGGPGIYFVYATWPISSNVSGGDTRFTATTSGDGFVLDFDQNGGGAGTGHEWYKIGEINWSSGPITITQEPTVINSYVSMRSAGLLFEFEVVPEPSVLALLGLGTVLAAGRRLRRGC